MDDVDRLLKAIRSMLNAVPAFWSKQAKKKQRKSNPIQDDAVQDQTFVRAPFRHQPKPTEFYVLAHIEPEPGWEICNVGIELPSGRPLKEHGKQRCYGVVLDGEWMKTQISFEELSTLTDKTITQENYLDFIPDETLVKLRIAEKTNEEPGVIECASQDCVYTGDKRVELFFMTMRQRFGAQAVFFRRAEDGYRVFYMRTRDSEHPFLPLASVPDETAVDLLAEDATSSYEVFDRLLADHEVSYFYRCFFREEKDDNEPRNDIYGSARVNAQYCVDGHDIHVTESTKFLLRIEDCLRGLAMKRLSIRSEFTS